MTTLLIAVLTFVGYIVAYHTYGRFLARRVFRLDADAPVPSRQLRDDVDFVPTRKEVIFGHHFTSIAGTGPIVGPAIAVFWGWLPALLWVLFGAIFIGAVHDFSALVISLRNRGQTVGQIAGRIISPRAKVLFLLILFFALSIVIAIFGLVIAKIFGRYPQAVLSVVVEMPMAVGIGFWVYRRKGNLLIPSLMALGVLYACIYIGVHWLPLQLPATWGNPTVIWTVLLLVYCYVASVLPVWVLLQPRDFINSHELMVALVLLVGGLGVACLTGQADIMESTPPLITDKAELPDGAPPMFPFLFITIACGAVSGFHCLVSSGTTSKQISRETDAQYVGYGSMLLEGTLAVLVIFACCAGIGMGIEGETGETLVGREAWRAVYASGGSWADFNLPRKVGAFVDGGANFVHSTGIPLELAIGIMAVLVASFAATTLDTATRLQRYVIQELAATVRAKPLANKYVATFIAVACGGALAMMRAKPGADYGTGGMILWPLFGAINQLLAGLALMVAVFYLWRRGRPVWFIAAPMVLLMILPGWGLLWQMFNSNSGWYKTNHLLLVVGFVVFALQIWMIVEGLLIRRRAKGVLEEPLPEMESRS